MSRNHSTSAPNPQPPEPSTDNQVDIANRVQKGIQDANDSGDRSSVDSDKPKATQFDGSPRSQPAEDGTFGPADDTPAVLPKRSGPKAGQA